jgi:hypothetical protein
VEQLSAPRHESLHLIVYRFEESDSGISLAAAIHAVEAEVDDLVLFESRLYAAGFRWEHIGSYETQYRVVSSLAFDVLKEGFPRIVGETFVGALMPPGTMQLAYVVDLSGPTPVPLSKVEHEDLICAMAES